MNRDTILIIDSTTEHHFDTPCVERQINSGNDVVLTHISSLSELDEKFLHKASVILVWACIPAIQFDDSFFKKTPHCQAIIKVAVGYDNIDVEAANKRQIQVFNIPDYGTEEVADHTIALLLACVRKLKISDDAVNKNQWDWSCIKPSVRLRGKTLGIIGFGRIGASVALRAKSFGLNVQFFDPYVVSGLDKSMGVVRTENLDELLISSDFISVNASLNKTSYAMLNDQSFEKMRKGVVIINTARGAIIDTPGLVNAFKSGKVSSAGLDVIQEEPRVHPYLKLNENVILTAHSAFYTEESFKEMRVKSATMARDLLAGKSVRNEIRCTGYEGES